ncbi:hypothetical protein OC846_002326 [Tilletia horrida]|uniref:NAD(P)-binding protein n=1 Tax=Tilletia horrida TaxID=155126 RepID=A0AAN6GUD4_9BASI|nr:hypothetical protein OC846_002326 [Tilletia horrida]KAK0567482.1 hypothetical protein OC861_002705 [Tilletia horrida]
MSAPTSSTRTLSLAGKNIFVAGASRGIGAALAKALAAQGAFVLVGYGSRKEAALEVVEAIKAETPGAKADVVGGDLASASGAQAIAKDILSKTGGSIDTLVLTSGYLGNVAIHNLNQEEWDKHISTNVTGPVFLVQSLLPHIRTEGRIIFFSSSLVVNPMSITPNYLSYLAAKGAIEQTVRVLARDPAITGAERRITVNCVAPGPVKTELFLEGKPEELVKKIASLTPRNTIAETEDIVGTILFLASPLSQWVVGQTLRVNGGMTC